MHRLQNVIYSIIVLETGLRSVLDKTCRTHPVENYNTANNCQSYYELKKTKHIINTAQAIYHNTCYTRENILEAMCFRHYCSERDSCPLDILFWVLNSATTHTQTLSIRSICDKPQNQSSWVYSPEWHTMALSINLPSESRIESPTLPPTFLSTWSMWLAFIFVTF